MNKQPLVSVVMPVYNAGDFFVEAIESILRQTYRHFELIIVDDASTDSSWRVITKYKKLYPKKIRTLRLSKNVNKGGDACANSGIRMARGKYIARMDADDIAHPQRLTKQVAFLEKRPEIFLVGSQAHVINTDGQIIGEKKEPTTHEEIYASYFHFHPIIHPSAMFHRFVNGNRFFYKIKYSANNDMYTFFCLAANGCRLANLPDKLLYYRIHSKSNTFSHVKENFYNTLKIRWEMVKKYGYCPTTMQWATTFAQLLLVLLLPEKLIVMLYLLSKGVTSLSLASIPGMESLLKLFTMKPGAVVQYH